MKNQNPLVKFTCLATLILFLFACKQPAPEPEYGEATRQLIAMVESDAELKAMLEKSIAMARQANPDPNTNPAQTLKDYYAFVSWAETSMPWALLKKGEYPEIFDNIFQSLCTFYFIISLLHIW